MTTIQGLVRDLYSRGVVCQPVGDKLRVDPIERLVPGELESLREHKAEILEMFRRGQLRIERCPSDSCSESLIVIDDLAYCNNHQMTVRFVEGGPH